MKPNEKKARIQQLIQWSNQNSFSNNTRGIKAMQKKLVEAFEELGGEMKEIPDAGALTITKRENAPLQILLGGHMDTVFPPESPFQKANWIDEKTLNGPGVADMKGGLMVMLLALLEFEKNPIAEKIGWKILINSDEEIGSPKSTPLFEKMAKGCKLGLLFEPAYPDGALAAARKGSINFTVIAKGKSAHAGRDFHLGKNAITALSRFIVEAEKITNLDEGITVNIGLVEGGGALNIVPEHALCGLNIRMEKGEDMPLIKEAIRHCLTDELIIHENSERLPKPFHKSLFEAMKGCADELNYPLTWTNTGGTCDGNTVSSVGVPNIDSLGPVGGKIHTYEEYILVDTLFERAELVTRFLTKLANGELL